MNTVNQILKTKGNDVFTIGPNTLAMDALKIMDEKGFGVLVIVENEELKGLFTEGDYISRVLLKGLDASSTLVDDVMTKNVLTITPKKTLNESMELMIEKDIRYFPVVDEGKLLGVISVGDCIKRIIVEQQETIGLLEQYIQS
ncbi:MAG: CBS domain-containing protein [Cocleimonas sp.]